MKRRDFFKIGAGILGVPLITIKQHKSDNIHCIEKGGEITFKNHGEAPQYIKVLNDVPPHRRHFRDSQLNTI